MASDEGPWGRKTPDPTAARRTPPPRIGGRRLLWLLFLAGLGGIVLALAKAFPEAVRTRDDWGNVAYFAGFLVLLAAGAFRARWVGVRQLLLHLAIWTAITAVLSLGYAYRDELAGAPQRLRLAFSTARPVATGDHELVIPQDDRGGFEVIGKVNGQRVRFLIDTGSSETVLTPDDARRLGVEPKALRYVEEAETANGKGYGAPFVADRLEIGPIALTDFKMSINQAPMTSSLLGLSFLNRLESFEIRGRELHLKWGAAPGG